MFDYLLRYAIDNIWCNPRQDKQFNFKLRRLSPLEGVRTSYVVEKERYPLPKVTERDLWHIYQIGQVTPPILGFPSVVGIWLPLTEMTNEYGLDCDVFPSNGVLFPRNETFLLMSESRNLIIAVRENSLFEPLRHVDPPLYLQIYTNSYFLSERSAGNRYKRIFTKIAKDQEDVRQFQIKGLDLIAQTGHHAKWFVNGRLVNEISAATAWRGDYLELVIDGSIKEYIDFPISKLESFKSSLDNVRKYILHRPGFDDTVDFFDDIDAYLYKPRDNNPNIFSGVFYHRNKGNWLRMLTHRDYSIPTDILEAFVAEHPIDPRWDGRDSPWPKDEWLDIDSLTVRLYIKHSGTFRTLINNVSRLKELYRLTDAQILRAMTGADAVAECWRAENLEKSRYLGFMGLDDEYVFPKGYGLNTLDHPNKQDIFDYAAGALGYHFAGKLLSDSPLKVLENSDSEKYFNLAYNFWEDSTVFEYGPNGELLGYYRHTFGDVYKPFNSNCELIEPFAGSFSNYINGHEGKEDVIIPYGYNFRVYVRDRNGEVWRDVTNTEELDTVGYLDTTDTQFRKWVWDYNERLVEVYIRCDNISYIKHMQFNKTAGVIRFNLDAFEFNYGTLVNRELTIPFGQYDVFLNGKSLINTIDYTFKDNRVVISNLEFLEGEVYNVIIRGTGYCDSNMEPFKPDEIGFIEYGVISSDGRYGLHSNKIQRIVADGKVLHPDDVIWDEDNTDDIMTNVRNGSPYQIQQPQYVFREVFKDDYAARVADDLIDKEVSDYLTYYLPKREREKVDSIDRRYKVISVASNLLIHLISTKKLQPVLINGRLDEEHARQSVSQYEWIKRYDVVNLGYNNNHVVVLPHWHDDPIGLEWWEYRLYRFLLKDFLISEIDLAPYIYIKRTV